MLTPSGVTAAEYWDAIKADNPTYVRMTFLDQNIVLENEDIDINTGVIVEDVLNGDVDLTFGRAVMKSVRTKIRLSEKTETLVWTGEFRLEFGVEIDETVHYVQVGIFSGERPVNVTTENTVEFTAYDRMKKFECLSDSYFAGMTYPRTVKVLYHRLVDFVYGDSTSGSTHHYSDGDALTATFNRSFSASPVETTGYTCRDVLEWIAEAVGCYARINAEGNCELVWFRDATGHVVSRSEEFYIEHADMFSGMRWNEFDEKTWNQAEVYLWDEVEGYYKAVYGVRGVKIKQTSLDMDLDYPSVQPWNVYTIMDNPFLVIQNVQTDPTNYVKPIYDRLNAFGGQLPLAADCVGNWCIESGDIITMHIGGEIIQSPVFFRTLTWNGAVRDHYETTGQKFRTIINDTQKQRVINNREIRMYVDGRYYDIKSGIAITEDGVEITGAKFLDLKSGADLRLYSGSDLQIQSGGALIINSGGRFQITSTNFNIDSSGNVTINGKLETTYWTFDQNGAKFKNYSNKSMAIGSDVNFDGTCGGIRFHINNYNFGVIDLVSNNTSGLPASYVSLENTSQNKGSFFQRGYSSDSISLGNENNPWYYSYIQNIRSVNSQLTFGVKMIDAQQSFSVNAWLPLTIAFAHDSTNNKELLYLMAGHTFISGGTTYQVQPILGQAGSEWDKIFGRDIYYYNLIQSSSREVKHNIVPIESIGGKLDRLEPVSFAYNDDPDEKKRFGLIYEDTVENIPEICNDNDGQKGINYVELIPLLLKEVQDLRKRVAELEVIVVEGKVK